MTELTCCCHLLCSQSKKLVCLVQHQVVQTEEQEAAAGQQTHQTKGRAHQQQAWKELKTHRVRKLDNLLWWQAM